ncbi:unnamed protein product [Didymodactylos carnosus]|uniref:Cyclin N-terminal domain-containing protein n=1 Tax=Didymodactylos carnosus TaxID=1234261 RepID=A0A814UNY2_9BILA|nr:unnamed protein product [Didymodactylos carnosus]CAF1336987.1 unnamed protein product [Didymodactylos carnosus]CAF3941483.1 unnamed protein product [Didymodactylos carnosus]CAF4148334.1 unnamed protein product [Didymodactylos carnosus]
MDALVPLTVAEGILPSTERILKSNLYVLYFLKETIINPFDLSRHYVQRILRTSNDKYLFDHANTILLQEAKSTIVLEYNGRWLQAEIASRGGLLSWRSSVVNWLIGIQRKNQMKDEVAQHAIRLMDSKDTLRGFYDRDYQLRALAYFILSAKFHNRIHVRLEEYARYTANAFGTKQDIAPTVRNVFRDLNFSLQIAIPYELMEIYLELNSNQYTINIPEIRNLGNLFLHIACVQAWSSCFNASLLASAVMYLCLKFVKDENIIQIPDYISFLWTTSYPFDLICGISGYIAMIVCDIHSVPTDRASHYFYATKLYLDDCHINYSLELVKSFCKRFVLIENVNKIISNGMRALVKSQKLIIEEQYINHLNSVSTLFPMTTTTTAAAAPYAALTSFSTQLIKQQQQQQTSSPDRDRHKQIDIAVKTVLCVKRFLNKLHDKQKLKEKNSKVMDISDHNYVQTIE